MFNPRIITILGVDDWLVFGQSLYGDYFYTVAEELIVWLDAPNKGQAEYGSSEWEEDWRFVVEWVRDHTLDLSWEPVTDDEFFIEQLERFGVADLDTRRDTPVWSAFVAERETAVNQAEATQKWDAEHPAPEPRLPWWGRVKRALQQ